MKKITSGVQVFISYRREGGRDIARNIYERLSFAGYNTFFDYDSMQNGQFNQQIYTAIDQAMDFVFILSKGALNRCCNEDDWVRKEIEYAIKQHKNIVLLSTEEHIDFPDNLPDSLALIRTLQATFLSQNYYDRSIEKLRESLKSKPNRKVPFLIILVLAFVAFILAGGICWGLSLFFSSNSNTHSVVKDYEATISLMRYENQRLRYGTAYDDFQWKTFHYEDSIDQNLETYVYPVSDFVAYAPNQIVKLSHMEDFTHYKLPVHLPMIQLKLHSMSSKTLVLTDAELIVEEFRYEDVPAYCFFEWDNNLIIYNTCSSSIKNGVLEYSWLHENESFTGFKNKQNVSMNTNPYPVKLSKHVLPSDSLFGYLVLQDGTKYGFARDNQTNIATSFNDNFTMPMPVFDIKKNSNIYQFNDFHRSLVKGEIDDEIAFLLRARENCRFRFRLKLTSPNGESLYSNYLNIRFCKMEEGKW